MIKSVLLTYRKNHIWTEATLMCSLIENKTSYL